MKNHNNFDKYFNSYVSKFSVNDINLKNYDIDDKKKSENGKKNLSNFNKKSISVNMKIKIVLFIHIK